MPNVFVVGQTGSGKSSVVNLIAGEKLADNSPDLSHCTKSCTKHSVTVDEKEFHIFDTSGFLEPDLDYNLYAQSIADTYGAAINTGSGVDLVLYCVRDDKIDDQKTMHNYTLFRKMLFDEEVPVAVVVTYRGNPKFTSGHYKSVFAARNIACVDCICANLVGTSGTDESADTESQDAVRKLLSKCCEAPASRSKLQQSLRSMKEFVFGGQNLTEKRVLALLTKQCNVKADAAKAVVTALQLSPKRRAPYSRGKHGHSTSQLKVNAPTKQKPAVLDTGSVTPALSAVDNSSLPDATTN